MEAVTGKDTDLMDGPDLLTFASQQAAEDSD